MSGDIICAMEKFSVQKPYTILVAVIMVLVLGVVSAMNMTTDLLPSISLPYLIVITPFPGASPERVETTVSEPMESALGTVSGVANVFSVSAENYSMTQLEFEDGTNMDSAMVKVSSAVEQVRGQLPDGVGTPSIMELSLDMIATMYVAVGYEDYDIYQLSDYVENELSQALERVEGVASVTGVGLVEQTIQVELDSYKIDRLNDRILSKTTSGLDEAGAALDEARQQVEDGEKELVNQQSSFGSQIAGGLTDQLDEPLQEVMHEAQVRLIDLIKAIEDLEKQLDELQEKLEERQKEGEEYTAAFRGASGDFGAAIRSAVADVRTAFEGLGKARERLSAALSGLRSAFEKVRNGASLTGEEIDEAVRLLIDAREETSERTLEYIEASSGLRDAVDALIEILEKIDLSAEPDAGKLLDSLRQIRESMQEHEEAVQKSVETLLQLSTEDAAKAFEDITELVQVAWDELQESGDMISAIRAVLETDPFVRKLQEIGNTVSRAVNGATGSLRRSASELSGIADIFRQTAANISGNSAQLIASGIGRITDILPKIKASLEEIAEQAKENAVTEADVDQAVAEAKYQIALIYQKAAQIPDLSVPAGEAIAMLTQGQLDAAVGFSQAGTQLTQAKSDLAQAQAQYDTIRESALKSANLDSLLSASTLAQLVYAQNFAMPAGYIDDKDDNTWLLKVGDEYGSPEDIETALLADVDGIGVIRLTDVATITVIDNADDSYTRLNGQDAVVLAVYKGSTAGTNDVSRKINASLRQMMREDPKLNVVFLMDQGNYITLIVEDLVTSMGLGALLAILVLALFLRNIRPTLMVGISIPLSVLFTVVLMYFTNLSLNIMTLSGLSLGIGMLVDNSIVVMENIMRLRQRGIPPARASVQGAKQVSNSIVASTLTTICVFLPMVFTTGTVRELLLPMALSITYCLTASLIVAMTVVPSSASVILRRIKQPKEGIFSKMLDAYGRMLNTLLDHKLFPLAIAAGLLALCIYLLIQMGVVLLPEMAGDNIQLSIDTHEYEDRDIAYQRADIVMEHIMSVDGVKDVGIMDESSTAGLVSSMAGGAGSVGKYIGYVTVEDGLGLAEMNNVIMEMQFATQYLESDVTISTSMMGDMGSFMSSGLSVNVYGRDLDRLKSIAEDVGHLIVDNGGFEHISTGTEETEPSLHLVIDKDKAMSYGLTVAQIYMQIAGKLTTEVSSTQVTVDGVNMNVLISDKTKMISRENLLDMEFESQSQSGAGMGMGTMGSMGSGMGAMSSGMPSAQTFGGTSGMPSGSGASMEDMFAMLLGQEEENDGETDEDRDSGAEDAAEEDTGVHKLSEFARIVETTAPSSINRENMVRYITVSADTKEGFNTTVQSRSLQRLLDDYNKTLPAGYAASIGGETTQVQEMIQQMSLLLLLALIFIYLVMVAQFQSLLSPFIILFTVPLAFTGGMIGLLISGEQLSMLSLMGFLVLMGTVVNNGIVFVDYTNQLRIGGVDRRTALIATGKTRMRPILMTTMTTVLAMMQMIFGDGIGAQMGRGMAIVIVGGLIYSTLMTLFIIPIMYDILYKKPPLSVDVGDDLDEAPDDAQELIGQMQDDNIQLQDETSEP